MHSPESGPSRGELNGSGHAGPHVAGGVRLTSAERDSLRREITALDRSILALVARRVEVAREIGLTKAKDGAKVRDASREEAVVKDFVEKARALGIDEANSTTIAKALINEAVRVQLEHGGRQLDGKKVLVIGAGRMGAWTARFASNRGAAVVVHDPRGTLEGYENVASLDESVSDADFTILASPLGTAREDLRALLSIRPSGVIFDVCSVKSHLKDLLREGATQGFRVTSVHPMFGPGAVTPTGRNVLVCGCGSSEADAAARELFESAGAAVTDIALDDHDRLIARTLGTPHLCALVFGRALSRSGLSEKELAAVEGPSFATLRGLAESISAESRRVYHDIQMLNPHTKKAIDEIEDALRELKEASLEEDPTGFARIMDDEKEYFGGGQDG